METIYNISLHIIVIWGSLLMLIAIFIALKILFFINYMRDMVEEAREKFLMLFTPAKIFEMLWKRRK